MNFRNHPLSEAARYNDAICEERGLKIACEQAGVDVDAALYVAHQRAIRLAFIALGRADELVEMHKTNDLKVIKHRSLAEEAVFNTMCDSFKAAVLDGIVIGSRSARSRG